MDRIQTPAQAQNGVIANLPYHKNNTEISVPYFLSEDGYSNYFKILAYGKRSSGAVLQQAAFFHNIERRKPENRETQTIRTGATRNTLRKHGISKNSVDNALKQLNELTLISYTATAGRSFDSIRFCMNTDAILERQKEVHGLLLRIKDERLTKRGAKTGDVCDKDVLKALDFVKAVERAKNAPLITQTQDDQNKPSEKTPFFVIPEKSQKDAGSVTNLLLNTLQEEKQSFNIYIKEKSNLKNSASIELTPRDAEKDFAFEKKKKGGGGAAGVVDNIDFTGQSVDNTDDFKRSGYGFDQLDQFLTDAVKEYQKERNRGLIAQLSEELTQHGIFLMEDTRGLKNSIFKKCLKAFIVSRFKREREKAAKTKNFKLIDLFIDFHINFSIYIPHIKGYLVRPKSERKTSKYVDYSKKEDTANLKATVPAPIPAPFDASKTIPAPTKEEIAGGLIQQNKQTESEKQTEVYNILNPIPNIKIAMKKPAKQPEKVEKKTMTAADYYRSQGNYEKAKEVEEAQNEHKAQEAAKMQAAGNMLDVMGGHTERKKAKTYEEKQLISMFEQSIYDLNKQIEGEENEGKRADMEYLRSKKMKQLRQMKE